MIRTGIVSRALYYSTAVLVACIPMGIVDAVYSHDYSPVSDSPKELWFIASISIPFGACTAILFGFFLRVLTKQIGQSLWHWTLLGAVLGPSLILCLGKVADLPLFNRGPAAHSSVLVAVEFFLFAGPVVMINGMGAHIVQLMTATAVISGITASTLFFIARRFGLSPAQ